MEKMLGKDLTKIEKEMYKVLGNVGIVLAKGLWVRTTPRGC